MTDYSRDRLWTRPVTLTEEERSKARLAFEETPSLLDGPVLAALGACDHGERIAAEMLGRVRSCATS